MLLIHVLFLVIAIAIFFTKKYLLFKHFCDDNVIGFKYFIYSFLSALVESKKSKYQGDLYKRIMSSGYETYDPNSHIRDYLILISMRNIFFDLMTDRVRCLIILEVLSVFILPESYLLLILCEILMLVIYLLCLSVEKIYFLINKFLLMLMGLANKWMFKSNKILTNSEAVKWFNKNKEYQGSKIYRKTKPSRLRLAVPGEEIETIIKGKIEVKAVAKENDIVVKSITEDEEEYIISEKIAFESYYIDKVLTDVFQEYKSNNYILAVKSYDNFKFIFHSGEFMIVEFDDYVAMKVDINDIVDENPRILDETHLYRIEKEYFKDHYSLFER